MIQYRYWVINNTDKEYSSTRGWHLRGSFLTLIQALYVRDGFNDESELWLVKEDYKLVLEDFEKRRII